MLLIAKMPMVGIDNVLYRHRPDLIMIQSKKLKEDEEENLAAESAAVRPL